MLSRYAASMGRFAAAVRAAPRATSCTARVPARTFAGAPGSVTSRALTDDEVATFHRDGFVMRRAMFDTAEARLLQEAARTDQLLEEHSFEIVDGLGGKSDVTVWNQPGDDIYGNVMRCARIVRSAEKLLQEEVYHYQTKLMRKDPKQGGSYPWHQDYGGWYSDGILAPKMVTAFVAVDRCTTSNGCLQLIAGSHELGRLKHRRVDGQASIDEKRRVAAIRQAMETRYAEMEPGDCLFLHCNTLHRSKANWSDTPRWALLASYNAVSNPPFKKTPFEHLHVVPDSNVKHIGVKRASDPSLFVQAVRPDASSSDSE